VYVLPFDGEIKLLITARAIEPQVNDSENVHGINHAKIVGCGCTPSNLINCRFIAGRSCNYIIAIVQLDQYINVITTGNRCANECACAAPRRADNNRREFNYGNKWSSRFQTGQAPGSGAEVVADLRRRRSRPRRRLWRVQNTATREHARGDGIWLVRPAVSPQFHELSRQLTQGSQPPDVPIAS